MAKTTSQVQKKSPLAEMVGDKLADELIREHAPELLPPFGQEKASKRRYPGEDEADYLLSYLSQFPEKRKWLLESVHALQRLEEALLDKDFHAFVHRFSEEGGMEASRRLHSAIKRSKLTGGVTKHGLVVRPTTPEGKAALAVLRLKKLRRLNRIRQCRHCGDHFYARFDHQWFCPDPKKKCQWNHFHTPEWRQQHRREQNRKHQRAYRERLFGKGRRGLIR
jgi:hypothetical protein